MSTTPCRIEDCSSTLSPAATAASSRILILDGGGLLPLIDMLRICGFASEAFPDGARALEYLAHGKVKIGGVLLNVQPSTAGRMTLLRQLLTCYPGIPIITVATVHDISLLRRSVELGASEYLVVPTNPELLAIKCRTAFLGQHRRTARGTTV